MFIIKLESPCSQYLKRSGEGKVELSQTVCHIFPRAAILFLEILHFAWYLLALPSGVARRKKIKLSNYFCLQGTRKTRSTVIVYEKKILAMFL